MSRTPSNSRENSSEPFSFPEYYESPPRIGEPGYRTPPLRDPSLSSLSSAYSVGHSSPSNSAVSALSPINSPASAFSPISGSRSSSPVEPSYSPLRSYSPQRRTFSPPRRSRDRVRRDPSKYRFSYERSRSPRTLSSDYHQKEQPSSFQVVNSRGSRSLSPQTWENQQGIQI